MGNGIRHAISPYEDLLTTVRKRMAWAHNKINMTCKDDPTGHDTRTEKADRKRRWEENITEWTGLKLGEVLQKDENREGWRKVVARSTVI